MNKLFILITVLTTSLFVNANATNFEHAGRKADEVVEHGKDKAREIGRSAAEGVETGAQKVEDGARRVENKLSR